MRKALPVLLVISIVASGCAATDDFEALERRTQQEEAAATQPAVRKSSHFDGQQFLENTGMTFEAIGAFLSLGLLNEMSDPDTGPTEAADYSPTATRKEVRGR